MPDRLKSSDKTLSYAKILELKSPQDAIDAFISREIDVLMHVPQIDRFQFIEGLLKLKLKENIPCWSDFIEVVERRHVFVHAGGVASTQYIQVCKEHGVAFNDDFKEGARLGAKDSYLKNAQLCMMEVTVRVSQLVYRKFWPDKKGKADSRLNDIGYLMLQDQNWAFADRVFGFALSLTPKHISTEQMYFIFAINRCIALKWSGKEQEMLKLLKSVDWSSGS